jgi:hypothetical protein
MTNEPITSRNNWSYTTSYIRAAHPLATTSGGKRRKPLPDIAGMRSPMAAAMGHSCRSFIPVNLGDELNEFIHKAIPVCSAVRGRMGSGIDSSD